MDKPAYVVNVDGAVVRDRAYLLVERGDESHAAGALAFPGGTVEQAPGGEDTVEATVRRELREEVGVDVGAVTYVCSGTFAADDGTRCMNVVTLCEHAGGEAHVAEPSEVAAVHWLEPAAVADHPAAPAYLESYVERVEAVRADVAWA